MKKRVWIACLSVVGLGLMLGSGLAWGEDLDPLTQYPHDPGYVKVLAKKGVGPVERGPIGPPRPIGVQPIGANAVGPTQGRSVGLAGISEGGALALAGGGIVSDPIVTAERSLRKTAIGLR